MISNPPEALTLGFRRYLGWVGLGLILAGVLYFLVSFYIEYGDPVTVMAESVALIIAGFIVRFARGQDTG